LVTILPNKKNGNHVLDVLQVLDADDAKVFVIVPIKSHFQAGIRGKSVTVEDYDDWHRGPTVVRFDPGDGQWTGTCGSTTYGKMTVVFIRKGMPKVKLPVAIKR